MVARAGERLGHGLDATVIALAGRPAPGKSTLFNLLAGRELSRAGVRRPTTSTTTAAVGSDVDAALLDWLDVRSRHALDDGAPAGLVLLDLPDFDSVEAAHRAEVDRLVRMVDLLVWVVDPQKYADAALHEGYLRPLAGHAAAMLVVLNQVDLLGGHGERAREDLRASLDRARPRRRARARRSRRAPVRAPRRCGRRSRSGCAAAARRWRGSRPTSTRAAGPLRGRRRRRASRRGRPARPRAARRGARRRPRAARRRPRRRARPHAPRHARRRAFPGRPGCGACGPIRCAASASAASRDEDARTSLPPPTPVQHAQVDSAIRSLAHQAATGLPDPWPALARRAATANEPELARPPGPRGRGRRPAHHAGPHWWSAARWLQRLLAAVALAGALWLALLAGLGYLQLGDAVPTPDVLRRAVPDRAARRRPRRRASCSAARPARQSVRRATRARARRALQERVLAVAGELVIAPLEAELGVHAALVEALDTALADGGSGRRSERARRRPAAVPSA